jgi:hypothetical protein
MSLNYNTELALINTTTNSGTITLPSATTVPGRVISFKDSVGNFNNKSLTLICDGSDTFEDGTVTKVLYESFGSIQVVASGTKWFILSGVKQNSMTISSLIASTIISETSLLNIINTKNINLLPLWDPYTLYTNSSKVIQNNNIYTSLQTNFNMNPLNPIPNWISDTNYYVGNYAFVEGFGCYKCIANIFGSIIPPNADYDAWVFFFWRCRNRSDMDSFYKSRNKYNRR